MEATYAFGAVALLLLLFSDYEFTQNTAAVTGGLLGFSVLLRPELLTFSLLCVLFSGHFLRREGKAQISIAMMLGLSIPISAWLLFSYFYLGSLLPTTFLAKTTTHLIVWNPTILRQYGELIALSMFWPSLLWAGCIPIVGKTLSRMSWLPLTGGLFFIAFYYLKTNGLESPGRYLLPALPLFSIAGAELLAQAMKIQSKVRWGRFVWPILLLHLATCAYFNFRLITPVLASFQSEYFASMRQAAAFLSASANSTDRVLVEVDIGALAYCGNGSFLIVDGGGLASPELAHKPVNEQIATVNPRFLVESQASGPGDLVKDYPTLLAVWHAAYQGHGLSTPKRLFVNIYSLKTNERLSSRTVR